MDDPFERGDLVDPPQLDIPGDVGTGEDPGELLKPFDVNLGSVRCQSRLLGWFDVNLDCQTCSVYFGFRRGNVWIESRLRTDS